MRRVVVFQRGQAWCFARADGTEVVAGTPLLAALEARAYAESFPDVSMGYIIRLQMSDASTESITLHQRIF